MTDTPRSASTPSELVPVPITTAEIEAMSDAQRGVVITQALVESRAWLAVATKGSDPTPIAAFRVWAATVHEMTRQKGLAQEIQLDALEMVRRAERGIGQAIRNGQEAGEIRGRNESGNFRGNQHQTGSGHLVAPTKPGPTDFARKSALLGSGPSKPGIYRLTDDVTNDEFDAALAEGRTENNLTRANIARKVQNAADERLKRPVTERIEQIRVLAQRHTSHEIADQLGLLPLYVRRLAARSGIEIRADRIIGKARNTVDPIAVIGSTVDDIANTVRATESLLNLDDFDQVYAAEATKWVQSLDESMRYLRKLRKELNHRAQAA